MANKPSKQELATHEKSLANEAHPLIPLSAPPPPEPTPIKPPKFDMRADETHPKAESN